MTGYWLPAPTHARLFDLARVEEEMTSVIGDVRDRDFLAKTMIEAQPEVVIHMAAQPIVRYSYAHPVETYATNVMGTVHLLEAVRATDSVRSVVVVTSDKSYENREWVWGYRETEPMGGYDPYSNSKGCAELVASAYRSSYFSGNKPSGKSVALATARAGNVIGGGDWAADRLIPDMIRAIEGNTPCQIRHPRAIRPWQHVLEPLNGYLLLAEKLFDEGEAFAEAWNFGPFDDDARPVEWIIEKICALWGNGASWRLEEDQAGLHEAHYLKLDCSKARARLGWLPVWSLEQGLSMIVDWNKSRLQGADVRGVTLSQIQEFEQT